MPSKTRQFTNQNIGTKADTSYVNALVRQVLSAVIRVNKTDAVKDWESGFSLFDNCSHLHYSRLMKAENVEEFLKVGPSVHFNNYATVLEKIIFSRTKSVDFSF